VPLWRSRRFYAFSAMAVVASMILSPQLQAQQVAAASERLGDRQAQQAASQTQAAAQSEALAAVSAPTSDPHIAPQAAPAAVVAQSVSLDTTDSDGDGLTDSEETTYGTCPKSGSSSSACVGVVSSLDSDADGIGDGIEVKKVGTDPDAADSDGDGISDFLEVNGFSYMAVWSPIRSSCATAARPPPPA
jgi:hypothetical protein